jgi:hypothetical protein
MYRSIHKLFRFEIIKVKLRNGLYMCEICDCSSPLPIFFFFFLNPYNFERPPKKIDNIILYKNLKSLLFIRWNASFFLYGSALYNSL